jgi:hypothetical protein
VLLYQDLGSGRYPYTWLVRHPVTDGYLPGKDEPLGLLSAIGQTSLHQQQIQPFFANSRHSRT